MARRRTLPPLRTSGFCWGPLRVELGLSLKDLSAQTRINKGFLSLMEQGRLIPTAEEFTRVMAVLDVVRSARSTETPAGAFPPASAGVS